MYLPTSCNTIILPLLIIHENETRQLGKGSIINNQTQKMHSLTWHKVRMQCSRQNKKRFYHSTYV